jgi:EpsI family protein
MLVETIRRMLVAPASDNIAVKRPIPFIHVSISQAGLIIIPFYYLFGKIVPSLVSDWYTHPSLSYGFLVPFVAGYLAWQKRAELKALTVTGTYWGCLPLALTIILFLIGQAIADAFLMSISMVLALVATVYLVLGRSYIKELQFPFFYLALMIPVPYALVKQVVNYLMFFDAALTEKILQVLGVPVFLELNFLHLPNITLEVADVCSGISSIFSLFVLGAAYAYLLPLPVSLKVLLTASTIPLAILVNLFRIIVTVLMAYQWGPVVLESLFHKLHGTFNFLLSVVSLIVIGAALRKRFAVHDIKAAQGVAAGVANARLATREERRRKGTAVVCLLILLLGIGASQAIDSRQVAPYPVLAKWPESLGSYAVSTRAWPDVYVDSNAEGSLSRFYTSPGGKPVELFVAYRGFGSNAARLNSPKLFFPELWNYVSVNSIQINVGANKPIWANLMVTQKGPSKRLVLYWYQLRGEPFLSELYYRIATLKSIILNSESPMTVVRIATSLEDGERLESAEVRLKEFAPLVYRQLNRSL